MNFVCEHGCFVWDSHIWWCSYFYSIQWLHKQITYLKILYANDLQLWLDLSQRVANEEISHTIIISVFEIFLMTLYVFQCYVSLFTNFKILTFKILLVQGHSKQSSWSGFGRITFSLGKNKVPFYKK